MLESLARAGLPLSGFCRAECIMTEWNASEYARISGLQQAMAKEVLALLDLRRAKIVLDVGCGNGKVTAEIASRVPQGTVVGVDSSADMIAFASKHFGPTVCPNLRFEIADARRLPFRNEFDLVVSLNALHWVREQDLALCSIRSALKADGVAQLRLVSAGKRKSLENVIEETRFSPKWARYFKGFTDPYLHLTPEQYGALAEQNGLHVRGIHSVEKTWDFQARPAFLAFGSVTFVEWTQFIPEKRRLDFVIDVLDAYRLVAADVPGEENTFKFYQMDLTLSPSKATPVPVLPDHISGDRW
jgi:trans-aconitate methyltransferase